MNNIRPLFENVRNKEFFGKPSIKQNTSKNDLINFLKQDLKQKPARIAAHILGVSRDASGKAQVIDLCAA